MGQGLLVGGAGGLPPLNSETIELPAYDTTIKPNTFVSIADIQADSWITELQDNKIVEDPSSNDAIQAQFFSIDTTHFALMYFTNSYTVVKIAKVNTDGTCEIIHTFSDNSRYNYTEKIRVIRLSNNRFFICRIQMNYNTSTADTRIVIKINSDYTVTKLYSYYNNTTNPMFEVSLCGTDLLLAIQMGTKYGSTQIYIQNIYTIKTDNSLELLYTVNDYLSNDHIYICVGLTDSRKAVLMNNNGTNWRDVNLTLWTITNSAATQIGTSVSIGSYDTGISPGYMISLGNSKYCLQFKKSSLALLTITDSSISLKNTATYTYTVPVPYEGSIIYDSVRKRILYLSQYATGHFEVYSANDLSPITQYDKLKDSISSLAGFGLAKTTENIYYGLATYSDLTNVRGLGRFDLSTLQECVRDSLDTSVISGLTLTTCTKNKAGKVCVLSGSTATMTSYGLQQNVVNTVIDDSIDAVQEEVQNAMDK